MLRGQSHVDLRSIAEVQFQEEGRLPFLDVLEFHQKFFPELLEQAEKRKLERELPDFAYELPADLQERALKMLDEELREYREAVAMNDAAAMSDALVDLIYVAVGAMVTHGFPIEQCWSEVHRANMDKVRCTEPSQSKRNTRLDCYKPADWQEPDMDKLLEQHLAKVKAGNA